MADIDREKLKRTFDQDAELYDRARPEYPEKIFDDLFALGGLKPGAEVLEIGSGTGRATSPLAQRGCRVKCIELGESLAVVARRNLAKFPHVEVVTSTFESWKPRDTLFDMVLAATSWHWLNPEVRYVKAASVLKSAGYSQSWTVAVTHSQMAPTHSSQRFENATKRSASRTWSGHRRGRTRCQTSAKRSNAVAFSEIRKLSGTCRPSTIPRIRT